MEKKITEEQVKKVAKLARLDLTDEEVKEFTAQLESILQYMEKMNQLDTEKVEPLAHCLPITNCFREDVIKESLDVQKALANAPQSDGDFFKVPKILDDASGA